MRDFLSDMIIRIKNGQQARLSAIKLHSMTPTICIKVLEVLQKEGYIRGIEEWYDQETQKRNLKVLLKYTSTGSPVIRNIFVVSKPGRRFYASSKLLWKPKNTGGIFLISTTKGIYSDRDTRLLNLGGEILCGVY